MGTEGAEPSPAERVALALATTAGLSAPLVELAVAGRGGVAAAAAAQVAAGVAGQALERRMRRAATSVEVGADAAGMSVDDFGEAIFADEARFELAVRVLSAATQTPLREKIDALGRSLAAGVLTDDAVALGVELMVVRALAEMEALHLAVLRQVAQPGPPRRGPEDVGGWNTELLSAAVPGAEDVVPALVSVLVLHGLVRNTLPSGSWGGLQGMVRWELTGLGAACLARLSGRPGR